MGESAGWSVLGPMGPRVEGLDGDRIMVPTVGALLDCDCVGVDGMEPPPSDGIAAGGVKVGTTG